MHQPEVAGTLALLEKQFGLQFEVEEKEMHGTQLHVSVEEKEMHSTQLHVSVAPHLPCLCCITWFAKQML